MLFTYRSHKAFVNLDPGGALHFALPPMTSGKLVVRATWLRVGPTDQPGDHSPGLRGSRPGRLRDIDWSRLRSVTEMPRTVPAWRASARRPPEGPLGDDRLPPDIGGDVSPAGEITFELYYGSQLVQKKVGQNIFVEVPPATALAYSLRISRAPDPNSSERRRYRIDSFYPSVLPQVDRRIPLKFLQDGFDRNWNNDQSYLEMLRVENQFVEYRWSDKLSSLYSLDREKTIRFSGPLAFPAIVAKSLNIYAGYENRAPSITTRNTAFFAVRLDVECVSSTTATYDIRGPIDVKLDLPRQMWFELRLYLTHVGGIMTYDPEIRTSLPMSEYPDLFRTRIKDRIREIEQQLRQLQWGEGGNGFDAIMRPWMVGYYEVLDIEYEPATDEIVIWHVGKPVKRPITIAPERPGAGWANLTKLFDTADDEKWAPSVASPGPRPGHTEPGNLAKIKNIIVLMQENRSFDQIFGYLSRDGHPELGLQPEVEGLLPGENPRDVNEHQLSQIADPKQFRSQAISDTSWPFPLDDPCHGRDCVAAQIAAGMKNFVRDYARRLKKPELITEENLQRIMNYYSPTALPVYAALAREFAICDHWFCSHIGGTLPNRHITLSGDLNIDRYGLPEEDNSNFKSYAPSERPTFFDHLTDRNVSWRLFEHGYSFLRLYRNFTFDISRVVAFDDPVRGFEAAAQLGELPSVSFIEPDYIELPDGNDDHAPADMHNGQRLIARIVRALINGGQWKESMLIITYDEHGGFYDHLVPPSEIEDRVGGGAVRPIPPLANGVSQLGPRVPALVISPLIPRGQGKVNVASKVYEHASIPATILRCFCSRSTPRMSPRVEAAHDLRDLLTLEEARPKSDFSGLLQVLEAVANSPIRRNPAVRPDPVPTRKISDPMDERFREDFHGFMAFASAVTGRSG